MHHSNHSRTPNKGSFNISLLTARRCYTKIFPTTHKFLPTFLASPFNQRSNFLPCWQDKGQSESHHFHTFLSQEACSFLLWPICLGSLTGYAPQPLLASLQDLCNFRCILHSFIPYMLASCSPWPSLLPPTHTVIFLPPNNNLKVLVEVLLQQYPIFLLSVPPSREIVLNSVSTSSPALIPSMFIILLRLPPLNATCFPSVSQVPVAS